MFLFALTMNGVWTNAVGMAFTLVSLSEARKSLSRWLQVPWCMRMLSAVTCGALWLLRVLRRSVSRTRLV